MDICYFVYREDNVMVYASQVLEYLQQLKEKPSVDKIGLVVFRHEKNLFKKNEVEERALQYVDWIKSFSSMPVLTTLQLRLNALRARRFVRNKYSKNESIAVLCRGELATYIAAVAFKGYDNVRILYDNRGLPVLESEMSYGNQIIHKINREKKYWSMCYAKNHCDMYNFVTNAMREFDINTYNYRKDIPYTIIPTLYRPLAVDPVHLHEVRISENLKEEDFVVSYVGATQAWQSAEELVRVIDLIGSKYPKAKFLLLTNGEFKELSQLDENVRNRIIKKTVPHKEMPYYLAMTNVGIVIRDDNMVNRVAAPTKIAEYITNGVAILYKGHIGVIDDLKRVDPTLGLINIDDDVSWLGMIGTVKKKSVSKSVLDYFDMSHRQEDTLQMIMKSMAQPMARRR